MFALVVFFLEGGGDSLEWGMVELVRSITIFKDLFSIKFETW